MIKHKTSYRLGSLHPGLKQQIRSTTYIPLTPYHEDDITSNLHDPYQKETNEINRCKLVDNSRNTL